METRRNSLFKLKRKEQRREIDQNLLVLIAVTAVDEILDAIFQRKA
jgi:hypothetical protein